MGQAWAAHATSPYRDTQQGSWRMWFRTWFWSSHTQGPGKGEEIFHPRAALGGWSKDPTRWVPSSCMLLFQTVARQSLRLPGLARHSGPPLPRTVGQDYHAPQQATIRSGEFEEWRPVFWGTTPSLGAPEGWRIYCSEYPAVWLGGGAGSGDTRKRNVCQRMQVLAIMQKYAEVCIGIKKLKVLKVRDGSSY